LIIFIVIITTIILHHRLLLPFCCRRARFTDVLLDVDASMFHIIISSSDFITTFQTFDYHFQSELFDVSFFFFISYATSHARLISANITFSLICRQIVTSVISDGFRFISSKIFFSFLLTLSVIIFAVSYRQFQFRIASQF